MNNSGTSAVYADITPGGCGVSSAQSDALEYTAWNARILRTLAASTKRTTE